MKTDKEVSRNIPNKQNKSYTFYTVLAQVFSIQKLGVNGSNYWFVMCHLMMLLYIIQFLISIYLWSLLN